MSEPSSVAEPEVEINSELNPLQALEQLTQQRWVWIGVAILWVSVFGFILLHNTFASDTGAAAPPPSDKQPSNKKKGKRKAQ